MALENGGACFKKKERFIDKVKISSSKQIMHIAFNGKSHIFSMFASDFFTYFYCLFNAVMPKGKEAWEENSFLYIRTKAREYQHLILAAGRERAT